MDVASHDHFFKINWAARALEQLDHAIIDWFKNNSHFIHKVVPDLENPPQLLLKVSADKIPIAPFSLIIGDIAHNVRSSLDYVVYALATTANASPLSEEIARKLQFPIFGNSNGADDSKFEKNTQKMLGDIGPEAKSLIKSIQPYHLSTDYRKHPLWLLQQLSNIDKHRILHVGAAYAGGPIVSRCIMSGTSKCLPGIVTDERVVAMLVRLQVLELGLA